LQNLDDIGWNVLAMVDGFKGTGTLEDFYVVLDVALVLFTAMTLRHLVTLARGRHVSPPRWSFLAVYLHGKTPSWMKWIWRMYTCLLVPTVILLEVPRLLTAPWNALIRTDIGLWLLVFACLRLLIGLLWLRRATSTRSRAYVTHNAPELSRV
jgi:hypothetical protein